MFRYTKMFIALPYALLLWFGQPYRTEGRYYRNIHQKWEHYLGRFVLFLVVLFLFGIFILILVVNPGGVVISGIVCVSVAFMFDLSILGCRSLLVYEQVKRIPAGENPLAVWNDRSLWEDD